jgi:hypothetical protein
VSAGLTATAGVLAVVVTAAALVCGVLALAATRSLSTALPVFLDLLLAAGLFRLIGSPGWQVLATAAALVALRRLIGTGLRIGGRTRSDTLPRARAVPLSRWQVVARRLVRPAWRR